MEKQKSHKRLITLLVVLAILLAGFLTVLSKREEIATSLAVKYYGGSSQCVAYVQRYYRNMFDVEIKNVGRAQNLFNLAEKFGLYAHKNGGGVAPQPGDILVFGHRNKIGHVSIITDVLQNGVKIIEQNWGTTTITINQNRPLKMGISDGNFSIEDRDDYWVIGWVSRINKNPGNFFSFPGGEAEGWYPDSHVSIEPENSDGLKVKVSGKNPAIASPVYLAGNSIKNPEKIEMRLKIENKNNQKGAGHLYLRGKDDNWSEDIPFSIDVNKDWQVYSVNLKDLPDDFEITQMRLTLNDNPEVKKETWIINWLQIY